MWTCGTDCPAAEPSYTQAIEHGCESVPSIGVAEGASRDTCLTAHGQTLTAILLLDDLADLLYREKQVRDLDWREISQPGNDSHRTDEYVWVSMCILC